jgi:hypothetical protein
LEYIIPLAIGTPAVTYNVTIDTGSSDFWLQSQTCTTGCFPSIQTFDTTTSTSWVSTGQQVEVDYGSGSVIGQAGSDVVSAGTGNSALTIQGVSISE